MSGTQKQEAKAKREGKIGKERQKKMQLKNADWHYPNMMEAKFKDRMFRVKIDRRVFSNLTKSKIQTFSTFCPKLLHQGAGKQGISCKLVNTNFIFQASAALEKAQNCTVKGRNIHRLKKMLI